VAGNWSHCPIKRIPVAGRDPICSRMTNGQDAAGRGAPAVPQSGEGVRRRFEMDYAQQQRSPMRHVIGITVVVALHVLLIWPSFLH